MTSGNSEASVAIQQPAASSTMADDDGQKIKAPIALAVATLENLTEMYLPHDKTPTVKLLLHDLTNLHVLCKEIMSSFIPPSHLPDRLASILINSFQASRPFAAELSGTATTLATIMLMGDANTTYMTAERTLKNLREILLNFSLTLKPLKRVLRLSPLIKNLGFNNQLDVFFNRVCNGRYSNNAFIAPAQPDTAPLLPFRSMQRAGFRKYIPNTQRSLLTDRQLYSWMVSDVDTIFHLYGHHATGKTVLAATIMEMLEVKLPSSDIGIAFAFFESVGEPLPMEKVFLVLIQQLVARMDHVPPYLRNVEQRKLPSSTLVDYFQLATMCFKHTFVFVDSITDAPAQDFVKWQRFLFCHRQGGTSSPIHVFLTHPFATHEPWSQREFSFTLQPDTDDLTAFVLKNLGSRDNLCGLFSGPNASEKEVIAQEIVDMADGR